VYWAYIWATLAERRLPAEDLQMRANGIAGQARQLLDAIELGSAKELVTALLQPPDR
jgi:hypothetical protein